MSLKKYVKDYTEIVIMVQPNDYELLNEEMKSWDKPKGIVIFRDIVFPGDDYMGQQACKLLAFDFVNTQYILFVDSDVIFNADTNIEQFMRDGKPCILKTAYNDLAEESEQGTDKKGAACIWQPITEKAAGFPVEFEYMRRLPLLYHKSTLKNLQWYFLEKHGVSIREYIMSMKDRAFSEFNLVGAYAEEFEPGRYSFLDTSKEPLPVKTCQQYWSWGGFTPEIKTEIESFLQ